MQLAGDNSASGETTEVETDVMVFHAWAEVYIPGASWIGLDATSGLLAGEEHIPLACTAVPASASPVTGTTESCQASFTYSSGVTRLE